MNRRKFISAGTMALTSLLNGYTINASPDPEMSTGSHLLKLVLSFAKSIGKEVLKETLVSLITNNFTAQYTKENLEEIRQHYKIDEVNFYNTPVPIIQYNDWNNCMVFWPSNNGNSSYKTITLDQTLTFPILSKVHDNNHSKDSLLYHEFAGLTETANSLNAQYFISPEIIGKILLPQKVRHRVILNNTNYESICVYKSNLGEVSIHSIISSDKKNTSGIIEFAGTTNSSKIAKYYEINFSKKLTP